MADNRRVGALILVCPSICQYKAGGCLENILLSWGAEEECGMREEKLHPSVQPAPPHA